MKRNKAPVRPARIQGYLLCVAQVDGRADWRPSADMAGALRQVRNHNRVWGTPETGAPGGTSWVCSKRKGVDYEQDPNCVSEERKR